MQINIDFVLTILIFICTFVMLSAMKQIIIINKTMNTIQTKTIQLQLENFKKRVTSWVTKKDFQIDVYEWSVANQILTEYKKSTTTLLVENDENDYDFLQAMNEIIEDVESNPSKVRNIVEDIFRSTQMEYMVCHPQILQLIFPNLQGELGIEYNISMHMNQK